MYQDCYVPSGDWFIGTVVSNRPELITEVCKWNQAVLWPEETCVSIPCRPHCSRHQLQPQHWWITSQLQPRAKDSDSLSTPREWPLALAHNQLLSNSLALRGMFQLQQSMSWSTNWHLKPLGVSQRYPLTGCPDWLVNSSTNSWTIMQTDRSAVTCRLLFVWESVPTG